MLQSELIISNPSVPPKTKISFSDFLVQPKAANYKSILFSTFKLMSDQVFKVVLKHSIKDDPPTIIG